MSRIYSPENRKIRKSGFLCDDLMIGSLVRCLLFLKSRFTDYNSIQYPQDSLGLKIAQQADQQINRHIGFTGFQQQELSLPVLDLRPEGGCADVFPELLGTALWPEIEDWKGTLLLLETSESDMPPELLTALLRNLQAQGILQVLAGILVGKPAYREREDSYKAVFRRVIAGEAGLPELPILWNVNAGHAYPTGVFPLGLLYELDCERKALRLMEPAAEA